MSQQVFVEALNEVKEDPINNLVFKHETPGNRVKNLASTVLQMKSENVDGFISLSNKFVGKIAAIIKGFPITKGQGRESMWKEVNTFIVEKTVIDEWRIMLCQETLNSDDFCMFYQFLTMSIVHGILSHENEQNNLATTTLDLHLTKEEQEVLYYVSGYIVFSLKRKYSKLSGTKNKDVSVAAVQFLDSLHISSDKQISGHSFLEFARRWVDTVTRGGLVRVNDDMFIFCRRIENVVRKVFNVNLIKSYKGEDVREFIEEELTKDNLVNLAWETLSRNLANKSLSDILKKQIIVKWVDLRAKAYVSAYVQIIRRRLAKLSSEKKAKSTVVISKKAEPAMRKTLS